MKLSLVSTLGLGLILLLALNQYEQAAPSSGSSKEAYVTLVYGDEFVPGVRVLGKSIRDTRTARDMVVLVSDGVSNYAKKLPLLQGTPCVRQNVSLDFGDVLGIVKDVVSKFETFGVGRRLWKIQNGATYVSIDKTSNPRNGSPTLLIQDDGGGMDPAAMRQCLSFGFSDKKSKSAIGKYGNGFKTSSMRLGADAIVFSRNIADMTFTQSIGLLSYTFLIQSGYDRIVVPMLHYKFNCVTETFEPLQPKSEHSNSNLFVLLKWSPYSTEEELLKQFETVGYHGTKIIIYNLWLDDEGKMELDFESDPEDIRIGWDGKSKAKDDSLKAISENHIAKRLHYSLRDTIGLRSFTAGCKLLQINRSKEFVFASHSFDIWESWTYEGSQDECKLVNCRNPSNAVEGNFLGADGGGGTKAVKGDEDRTIIGVNLEVGSEAQGAEEGNPETVMGG